MKHFFFTNFEEKKLLYVLAILEFSDISIHKDGFWQSVM